MIRIHKKGQYYYIEMSQCIMAEEAYFDNLDDFVLVFDKLGRDFAQKNLIGPIREETEEAIITFLERFNS